MNSAKQSTQQRGSRILSLSFAIFTVLLAGLALAPAAKAQARPGSYRCVKMEVDSKASRCVSPSLVLYADGSYQIWGENGTYSVVQDRWLVLSHSKRRGLGYLQKDDTIVFEYKSGKRLCRVIFERQYQPSRGFIQG
jgi:hypothetical protein